MNGWVSTAGQFHTRVKANCWDSLAGELLTLHQPFVVRGQPTCRGCDRDQGSTDPVWPCRTYTIIAARMLSIRHDDVEVTLRRLLAVSEAMVTYPLRGPAGSRLRAQP